MAMAKFRMLPRTSRIVALCSAANFINAADRVIMPIAIVPMTDEFKWNLYWQGWVLSAFAFGYFTSQVPFPYSPRPPLIIQCVIFSPQDHRREHGESFQLQDGAHAGSAAVVH